LKKKPKLPRIFFSRRTDRKAVNLAGISGKEVLAEEIFPPDLSGIGHIYMIHFMPGVTIKKHFFIYKEEEMGYMISGNLLVTIGEKINSFEEGDSILLKSEVPTAWENRTDEVARLIWIVRGKL